MRCGTVSKSVIFYNDQAKHGGGFVFDEQYYIGWGTLALINAGLAQGKNRSGFNWFLLSIFLGPVATFILLFMEKNEG